MPHQSFTSKQIRAFTTEPLYNSEILFSKNPAYPKISVVVPSYNQVQFLEKTLLSILNQNYPNTEIIVMDGGSEDGSVELIKKYEPYITYWESKTDAGQPNAINRGFAIASGDLIGWQNSDDIYLPNFFHTIAESFRLYPWAELFVGNLYIIDENDEITGNLRFTPFSVYHLMYVDWNLSSQVAFIKSGLLEKIGPLREDIQVEFDWDWFIRAGKVVKYPVLHNIQGGCYRIHSDSKFSTQTPELRWPIVVDMLRSHGLKIREDLPYHRQRWWQPRILKLRWRLYFILLYQPRLRFFRKPVLWLLAKLGIVCRGF